MKRNCADLLQAALFLYMHEESNCVCGRQHQNLKQKLRCFFQQPLLTAGENLFLWKAHNIPRVSFTIANLLPDRGREAMQLMSRRPC